MAYTGRPLPIWVQYTFFRFLACERVARVLLLKVYEREGKSVIPVCRKALKQEKITDFHFLDILGYLKNTHKNPKFGRSETSPNQGTWLGIPWLGLVSLCQIWDFLWVFVKYPKISKNGNLLFFSCEYNWTTVLSVKYVNHCDTSLWIWSCCTNAAVRAKIHLYLLLVLSFVNPPSFLCPLHVLPCPIDVW